MCECVCMCVYTMTYYQQKRKERLNALLDEIREHETIEKHKIKAKAALEIGVSDEKCEEYLKTLQDAGEIKLTDTGYVEAVED